MKRIFLDKIDSWKNGIIIIPAIILLLIANLDFLKEFINDFGTITSRIANFLMVIFFGKMFIFRNYVSWNKVGLNIKVGQIFGKGFSFNKIASFKLENGILNVIKTNEKDYRFDLNNTLKPDQDKLIKILEDNVVVSNNGIFTHT